MPCAACDLCCVTVSPNTRWGRLRKPFSQCWRRLKQSTTIIVSRIPVRTAIVRAALGMIVKVDPPRTLADRNDKVLFAQLDPDIRQIIAEREPDGTERLRRLQNAAAEVTKDSTTAPMRP